MMFKLDLCLFSTNKKYEFDHKFTGKFYLAIYTKSDEIVGTFDSYEELANYFKVDYEWIHRRINVGLQGKQKDITINGKDYQVFAYEYK